MAYDFNKYSGNNDFRGFLAANGLNKYLNYTGNDGKVNNTDLIKSIYGTGKVLGDTGTDIRFAQSMNNNDDNYKDYESTPTIVSALYDAWKANSSGATDTASSSTTSRTSKVSSGTGTSTTTPTLNQAAVDATNKAIDSLGVEQDTGYRNIDDSFSSLMSKYNKESAANEADYTEQGETNTNNLQKNKQNALVAAAQGRRGLRGTLASIGALSGDGGVLADRAVTTSANQDIGEAADTYATNARNLNKSINNFRDEDKDRQAEANTTRGNQRTALEGSIASKRQNYFQKLAEIFGQADQTGKANDFLRKAGDLNNEIASKSRVTSTAFAPRSAAFTPKSLESYLAGAGDMTVDVADGGAGGQSSVTSLLAGSNRKKEKRESATE